jgi:alkaline phosphatase D
MQRRDFLRRAILGGGAASTLAWRLSPAIAAAGLKKPDFRTTPFRLGVASGYPQEDGMILWTRLVPEPIVQPTLDEVDDIELVFEIARDPDFRQVVQRGLTRAEAVFAHSVHHRVRGLASGYEYFYRFIAKDFVSPVGRTWTASPGGPPQSSLRIGVASCQHYEQGYYHAWQHMVDSGVDLILHLGDYIYEGNTQRPVRAHDQGECLTLADYRRRYSWYRADPLLMAAHAACPWLVTHDDHEVDNDYAGLQAERREDQAGFALRRAAAYQAYFEHMPLPRDALLGSGALQLYRDHSLGSLVSIHMLDERQYRSPQACPKPPRLGGSRVFVDECPEWYASDRSMLGAAQERWFASSLQQSKSRWNLIAQGVVLTLVDEDPGPRQQHWNDSWAGYPTARQRLIDTVAASGAGNPLFLGGDIHAFIAADQRADVSDPASPIVMSELVTTSITSGPPPQKVIDAYNREDAPSVHFANGRHRGYLRLELERDRLDAKLIGFDSVRNETTAQATTLAGFELLADEPGLRRRE